MFITSHKEKRENSYFKKNKYGTDLFLSLMKKKSANDQI